MRVHDDEGTWIVKFIYDGPNTLCLLKKDGGEFQQGAMVRRFSKDPNNKFVARKIAFQKLISKFQSREDRRVFWDTFLLQCKIPDKHGTSFWTKNSPHSKSTYDELGFSFEKNNSKLSDGVQGTSRWFKHNGAISVGFDEAGNITSITPVPDPGEIYGALEEIKGSWKDCGDGLRKTANEPYYEVVRKDVF